MGRKESNQIKQKQNGPFQGGTSFVDHLCCIGLVFVMPLCASVYFCLERADLLALVCGV